MPTILVVVADELRQHGREVLLVQHDEVVQAVAAERPGHAFGDGVCLWRVHWAGDGVDADTLSACTEVTAIDRIPVA